MLMRHTIYTCSFVIRDIVCTIFSELGTSTDQKIEFTLCLVNMVHVYTMSNPTN